MEHEIVPHRAHDLATVAATVMVVVEVICWRNSWALELQQRVAKLY